jgi:hypothetical protein
MLVRGTDNVAWLGKINNGYASMNQASPVFRKAFGILVRLGIGLHNYLVEVRGRKTGRLRETLERS